MPELFVELLSEEIPARMQARGADDLARLMTEALAPLSPQDARAYCGPRRIALAATVRAGVAAGSRRERGPRVAAPEQALAGFLRKHGADRDELRQEGEFWVLDRAVPGLDAATLVAREMPGLLRKFPWPKSMRWGGGSRFTWVRPLRRILCILDGDIVPFDLRDGEDDGHGLASSNLTEGHRFLSPGAFAVTSEAQWRDELLRRHVIVDAAARRRSVWDGIAAKAAEQTLSAVEDAGLLDEVAGLVEWPVPLLGRIDAAFMDLPPEVMQVSMRVNQRYFALRDADGTAAPWFAFAANIEANDGGAAIVAGNERVLRARFSDARYFWDLDRTRTLESRVEDLKAVTFHAKLGTQYERAKRLERIAGEIAPLMGANVASSQRAALLCKADLTTGMVGEFPELQGVMGGYYADPKYNDGHGEDRAVFEAIRDHYAPRGPGDAAPVASVSATVALTDKLDQLTQFFAIGEKPTGSGDPFALRRAGLGIIAILVVGHRDISLRTLIEKAGGQTVAADLVEFLRERLRVQWRNQGSRHDIVAAAISGGGDRVDDLARRLVALEHFIKHEDPQDLLSGYRRANNILRIENSKDGPHTDSVDPDLLQDVSEEQLFRYMQEIQPVIDDALLAARYPEAMRELSGLRERLDGFFDRVAVNNPDPKLRLNRLRLLNAVVSLMNTVADFSKIEG